MSGHRHCMTIALLIGLIALVSMAGANPIPWPRPASMPLEDMYATLEETEQGGLRETFTGDYYFDSIPDDVMLMKYPVPFESTSICVMQGKLPKDWHYSPELFPLLHEAQTPMIKVDWNFIRELYPTVLPEWPGIPMIAWKGPFPVKSLFKVTYEHDLLKRGHDFIYFYALGTGKYFDIYNKEALAYLDITMPAKFSMHRLFLDREPHAFAVTREENDSGEPKRIVSIAAASRFGPLTRDIIGHIRCLHHIDNDQVMDSKQVRFVYTVDHCTLTSPSLEKPDIVPSGRHMLVSDRIVFNCCPEYVRMTILVKDRRVVFQEKAMQEYPCDCICSYPMKGRAGPFAPGTYRVALKNPYGKTLVEKEIEIQPQLPCEGDFDHDHDVDGHDLAVFAADFGRTDCTTAGGCQGDFDADGDVDGSDLAVFGADFGRTDCP